MGSHDYLSTACWHGLHDACRRVCKYCPATCSCACHADVLLELANEGREA